MFLLHSIIIKKNYHEYHQHGGCTNRTINDNKQTNKHTEGKRERKKNIKGGSLVDVSLTMTLYNDKMHE